MDQKPNPFLDLHQVFPNILGRDEAGSQEQIDTTHELAHRYLTICFSCDYLFALFQTIVTIHKVVYFKEKELIICSWTVSAKQNAKTYLSIVL